MIAVLHLSLVREDSASIGHDACQTEIIGKEIGIEDLSLQKLYANLFNKRISKTERLSNWERDVLTDKQKQYAAIDAWACIQLYEELLRLEETGDYELHALEMELEIEEDFRIYEELATQRGKGG